MSTDDLLQLLRDLVAKHHGVVPDDDRIGPGFQPHDLEALVEGFAVLDAHLSKGGDLPSAWQRSEDYEEQLNKWAKTYNAYERFTEDWPLAYRILRPLVKEWETHQRIPDWAGVDLLRAWAFYCARAADKDSHQSLLEGYPEIVAIAEAVRNHPYATKRDMPPVRN